MPVDTSGVDRALGAIGTTFRLTRLYPSTHPAVMEAMRQITAAIPALAKIGTVEWKVGATGLHWYGQHLLPRNAQVAELAGLLYARGVRAIQLNPGVTAEQVLAFFGVATGNVPLDDPALGQITLTLGRRTTQRLSAVRMPAPVAGAPPAGPVPPPAADAAAPPATPSPPVELPTGRRASMTFRPDVLPADVEAKRAIAGVRSADTPEARRAAVDKLLALAPALLAQRDAAVVAEAVTALDALLPAAQDPGLLEAIGAAASALTDQAIVERMVTRLGEARVPPAEREALVGAVGALATVSVSLVLEAFHAARPDGREPYRAAIRKAADRALEPLVGRLTDQNPEVVAAAAELLGLTGSPPALPHLTPLLRHRADVVREAAVRALAEVGGREISRPIMPALKDESSAVRAAAARAIAAGGDPASTTVLVRRLEQEEDEGVLAELLRAIGQLGAKEALEVLAKYAEPGGLMKRRGTTIRAAAIDGLRHLTRPEARALLELYSKDKDPQVREAAEAALR